MKFAHLSDLHLGKRLHQFSLMEDQRYILQQALTVFEREKVESVLIAGDVFDKVHASGEAIALFDWFLEELVKRRLTVFIISGNHDSPERIAFGKALLALGKVYVSPVFRGDVVSVTLSDAYGEIDVYLLPFLKPVHARYYYPEARIENYTEALALVLKDYPLHRERRNILVAHQFVAGAQRSDSEEIAIGGLEQVDSRVFEAFDYVALGHLHRPQRAGDARFRYCGSPLAYSFSEAPCVEQEGERGETSGSPTGVEKSVTILDMREKGDLRISTVPLKPLHDMAVLRGSFVWMTQEASLTGRYKDSYVKAVLLEEEDIPHGFARLADKYPGLMQMEYDNARTGKRRELTHVRPGERLLPEDLFERFYREMNHRPMDERQHRYLREKIEHIWR